MTSEEKLKLLLDTGEYDFIKDISKENIWKLIFAVSYIEDVVPISVLEDIKAEIKEEADCSMGEIGDGYYDALDIIDKHIGGAKMVEPQESEE